MTARHRVLPSHGALLVSTDLHGNLDDLHALCAVFDALPPDAHWVILGDLVHGPNAQSREDEPLLYDYEDASIAVVERVAALLEQHPTRVHLVLGNHDHGHVGGAHTNKFHPDEVEHLESRMTAAQRDAMRAMFERALLAVAAPCGVLLSHGSMDDRIEHLADLDAIALDGNGNTPYQRHVLACVLRAYGQSEPRSRGCMANLSRALGFALTTVIHGHDRDESGLFYEADTQVCPVIFGALRENKRYVLLDLGARYEGPMALRDGHEIRRLHP